MKTENSDFSGMKTFVIEDISSSAETIEERKEIHGSAKEMAFFPKQVKHP